MEEFEDEQLKALVDKSVIDKMDTGKQQMLDLSTRKWIAINVPDLFDPYVDVENKMSEARLHKLFYPEDISKASVHNNIYLRFPELSPTFMLRDIETAKALSFLVKVSSHYSKLCGK